MRRGSTDGNRNESITDVWLGQRMAGPRRGRLSRPRTWTRHPKRNRGVSSARATGKSHPYSRSRSRPDSLTTAAYDADPPRADVPSWVGVECVAHLVETGGAVAGPRRLPALQPIGGLGHHLVVPLPRVAVVVPQHRQADGRGVPMAAELGYE